MPTPPRPFIPAAQCARLELIYEFLFQRMENVLYFQNAGGFGLPVLTDLVESVEAAWIANMKPVTSAGVDLAIVKGTGLDVPEDFQVEVEPGATAIGALTSPAMPGNVTVATKFSTGHIGRSRRGRAYFVGLTEAQCSLNQLAAGEADAITAAWSGFIEDLLTAVPDTQHVIVSYVENDEWRSDALVTPVVSYSTNNDLDSQRRRLSGRGL